ncbi:MAG: type I DNA topoisomerase [Cytophagales bacterium]|nr:type I DNA topoisomerase [Cytophagales bacterium]
MAKNLVIVESPAKAKTIEGYLGKDYIVKSSFGHVRDLPKGDKAIDVENNFQPTYEVSKDKKEVVRDLKKSVKDVETVWLATDDDREGEAISWHLYETLKLKDDNTKRIVFHEITKKAITKAINSPRTIDIDLVNAQQARRVLDRLVGFQLSPVLWKKIKYGLSAGRVQSVAVRLIVDKEREINAFSTSPFYRITAEFVVDNNKILKAELSEKFDNLENAQSFIQSCQNEQYSIANLEKKPGTKKPAAPFTTSTLQQEASRKLGFSVAQTMAVAQRLYESGKITYMRTDSTNLSDDAIANAQQEIVGQYGNEYFERRTYKTKSAGAQEAHEAIRPTDFSKHTVEGERNEIRLYELIWKRGIASQMANAQIEKTIAKINISNVDKQLKATGEVVTFEGFLKVYLESSDEDEDEENKGMLPPLSVGQNLALNFVKATERFTRPPARYSEASLVKKLEDLGIGRPSTYAPTISTIQKRGYVEKEPKEGVQRLYKEILLDNTQTISELEKSETTGAEKGKLNPTDIAMVVNDFLVKHFPNVTNFSFTAKIEEEFDEIAQGKVEWVKMMGDFYEGFHKRVEISEEIDRSEVGTARELGTDPASGRTVLVRLGRYGFMAQIGIQEELDEEEKPKYASLRKGQHMESISLEDALELFKLPRDVGMFEDKKVVAAIGRFGPYIRHDGKFVSLKEDDPLEVSEDRAIELIIQKRKDDAAKFIKGFDEDENTQILNGRWGPYIKMGKTNVKIPKTIEDPTTLTYEDCLKLAEEQEKAKKGGKKKAPAKKATTTKKTTTAKKKAPAKKTSTAKAKK